MADGSEALRGLFPGPQMRKTHFTACTAVPTSREQLVSSFHEAISLPLSPRSGLLATLT